MALTLAVDYGVKRIGFAVGDELTRVATPLPPESAAGSPVKDAGIVLGRAYEYGAAIIVVGLPLNMDGTEGRQAKLTRTFAKALESRFEGTVALIDERLSSRGADELLRQSDLSRDKRKQRRDSVAAMIILQAYLDQCRSDSADEDSIASDDLLDYPDTTVDD